LREVNDQYSRETIYYSQRLSRYLFCSGS